jgi:hypothetical protein
VALDLVHGCGTIGPVTRWWLPLVLVLALVGSSAAGVFKPRGNAKGKKAAPTAPAKKPAPKAAPRAEAKRPAPKKPPSRVARGDAGKKKKSPSKVDDDDDDDGDDVIFRDDD